MTEFFQMGGYAFYVWASYGLTALVLAYNFLAPIGRERLLLRKLAARAAREET